MASVERARVELVNVVAVGIALAVDRADVAQPLGRVVVRCDIAFAVCRITHRVRSDQSFTAERATSSYASVRDVVLVVDHRP